jgi:hypothetical protein
MDNNDYENYSWLRELEAEMRSDTFDVERLKHLYETASSVACLGLLPARDGQPERVVSVEEQMESVRYLVRLTEEVPDPI